MGSWKARRTTPSLALVAVMAAGLLAAPTTATAIMDNDRDGQRPRIAIKVSGVPQDARVVVRADGPGSADRVLKERPGRKWHHLKPGRYKLVPRPIRIGSRHWRAPRVTVRLDANDVQRVHLKFQRRHPSAGTAPSAGPAPRTSPSEPARMTDWEVQVVDLTNVARSTARMCGSSHFPAVPPLQATDLLGEIARGHAVDMATRDFFDHNTPDGITPRQRMDKGGYEYASAGENIAVGYDSPQTVVDGWLQSSGHCSNIMSGNVTELGVGYSSGTSASAYSSYWVQSFAKPS